MDQALTGRRELHISALLLLFVSTFSFAEKQYIPTPPPPRSTEEMEEALSEAKRAAAQQQHGSENRSGRSSWDRPLLDRAIGGFLGALLLSLLIVGLRAMGKMVGRAKSITIDGWQRLSIVGAVLWISCAYGFSDNWDEAHKRALGAIGVLLIPTIARWVKRGFSEGR